MASSSAKEKFDAAVKVIRGLPANGPFQPSHELMLKFYSYYKQATQGRCTAPKPSFWDVVNKKKWEAWTNLGNMERDKAMLLYVEELKKVSNHVKETFYPPQIVETMPQTEEVNQFLQKLDTFYEMVDDAQLQQQLPEIHNNNVKDTDEVNGLGHLPNGDVQSITNDGGRDNLNHSENLTLLLKQDMKKAQEGPGILLSEKKKTNGQRVFQNGDHSYSKTPHVNGNAKHGGDGEETDGEIDEEEELIQSTTSQKNLSTPPPHPPNGEAGRENEEDQENSVDDWSGSETENEEFCDTSDEPVVIQTPGLSPLPSSFQPNHHTATTTAVTDIQSSISYQHNPYHSSTPLALSKTSRITGADTISMFSNNIHHNHRLLSESLEVNASGIGTDHQNDIVDSTAVNVSLFAGQDYSTSSRDESVNLVDSEVNCRGGDEDEEGREKRRKKGSQSSRGTGRGIGGRGAGGLGGTGPGGYDDGSWRMPYSNQGSGGSGDPNSGLQGSRNDLNEQIVATLLRLQRDMSGVLHRLHSLEALVKEGRKEKEEKKQLGKKNWWWPFPDLSFKSATLIFLWPIILQVVLVYLSRRRRKLHK